MTVFKGLSAFPPTPADESGIVDTDALGVLVDRLANAGVDSVSVLGSTGAYAYLDRDQRNRAVAAAVEAAAGRVPVVVGIGALRTSWSCELAVAAQSAGASGLLLAPMSYTQLSAREVGHHFKAVAASSGLPLCIYNNPGTTNFVFSHDLIVELANVPGIAAVKMPPLDGQDYTAEIEELRARVPEDFKIGYSGDWCAAPAFLACCRSQQFASRRLRLPAMLRKLRGCRRFAHPCGRSLKSTAACALSMGSQKSSG